FDCSVASVRRANTLPAAMRTAAAAQCRIGSIEVPMTIPPAVHCANFVLRCSPSCVARAAFPVAHHSQSLVLAGTEYLSDSPSPPISSPRARSPGCKELGVHSRYGLHARHVTVYRDALVTKRLQPFRCLHSCSGCFRLEHFAGWDSHPLESAAFSRRTSEAVVQIRTLTLHHALLSRLRIGQVATVLLLRSGQRTG